MVGLGALFHAPALVFLVAYPFSRKKFDKWYVIVVSTLMTAMYLYRNQLVYFFEDAYRSEAAADAMLAREVSGVGGRFIGMLLIMMLAMMLRPLTRKDRIYTKVFNVMVLAAAFQMMSVFNNTYTRLSLLCCLSPCLCSRSLLRRNWHIERRAVLFKIPNFVLCFR